VDVHQDARALENEPKEIGLIPKVSNALRAETLVKEITRDVASLRVSSRDCNALR
jgi:hypothetical protein